MNGRRGGLGRGLGALIPQGEHSVRINPAEPGDSSGAPAVDLDADSAEQAASSPIGAHYAELDPSSITPNPRQPRTVFDEDGLDELAASIREVGILQPVVVREVAQDRYELVMGERRWRAATTLGLDRLPAIVRETADDTLLRDALLENLQRRDLNPLEEAAAYQQLLEEFGSTHDELAQRLGRSRPQITNTLRLLNLPTGVQRRVAAGVLSAGHARALLALPDAVAQDELAARIVAEGLSVRSVEELVAMHDDQAGSGKHRTARQPRPHAPALEHVADRLSDHFETRVKVELGRRKGRVVVEFATVDDLERIIGVMAPALGPVHAPTNEQAPVGDVSVADESQVVDASANAPSASNAVPSAPPARDSAGANPAEFAG